MDGAILGGLRACRDVVSLEAPKATGPHFLDTRMHVLHALPPLIAMNLLSYTDSFVLTCGTPSDT
jgi:hypothetical protein